MAKLRIFIDFWNFQLNACNIMGRGYRADWMKISPWLTTQAQTLTGSALDYEETRVYMSYNPASQDDSYLVNWATNTLDRFPGIHVVLKQRNFRHPQTCQKCHMQITKCSNCGEVLKGTVEKGVDTAIVTDLLSLAWEGAWNVAVLVSTDQDYVPAVDMLNRKGFRVISAFFPQSGFEISRHCWASIDLTKALSVIVRNQEV